MEHSGRDVDHGEVPLKNRKESIKNDAEPAKSEEGTENNESLPSQECTYIIPGERTNESYRLGTFAKFPNFDKVSSWLRSLAVSGFYFTGFKDRIQCFSCGGTAENLTPCADVGKKWHKKDCGMITGKDPLNVARQSNKRQYNNIPCNITRRLNVSANNCNGLQRQQGCDGVPSLSQRCQKMRLEQSTATAGASCDKKEKRKEWLSVLNLGREVDRRKTFATWPNKGLSSLISDLAINGFYYVGENDEMKCFSCAGVLRNLKKDDNVTEKHRSNFPDCRIIRGIESGNLPMTEAQRQNTDNQGPTQFFPKQDRTYTGGSQTPFNPDMDKLEARKESFSTGWPENAGIFFGDLAEAGFYSFGECDRIKCFYCNGGLENWKQGYDPWIEHAKWFPSCKHLLEKKGVDFVQRVCEPHRQNKTAMPRGHDSPPTKTAKLMRKDDAGSDEAHCSTTECKCITESQGNPEEHQVCRMCKQNEIDIELVPCGHKYCCDDCAKRSLFPCPLCKRKIESTRKVYRK